MTSGDRSRLDVLIAERGLGASRARARDAILRGRVRVGGALATRPGQSVPPNAEISVDDPADRYVSRSALKLEGALDALGLDVSGLSALDIGASTGGFTEVLLRRGAAHVLAIDVGHGQMHPRVRDDGRVTAIEGLNARDLREGHLGGRAVEVVVCDVSFISLTLALPPVLALAAQGALGVFLVKPQFEAGRSAIGRNGLLKDPGAGPRVAEGLRGWLDARLGWTATALLPSPILGGEGAQEFLLAGRKSCSNG